MNNQEYLDFIRGCERTYKVSDWRLGGMDLWPIFRCFAFKSRVKGNSSKSGIFSAIKKRIAHTVNFFWDLKNNVWFPHKCDILFLGNGATKSLFEESWYDYLVQPIMESHQAAGETCLFLERGIFYRYPRNCKSLLTRTFEEIAVVLAKIFIHLIPKQELPFAIANPKSFLTYALGVKFISYFYCAILKITKPKKVYIVCYYTISGMAMCYACAMLEIPTIELQHGNTHNNFAYQGWDQTPISGYNTIPKAFWFWTKDDKQEFLTTNSKAFIKNASTKICSIPWIAFWKSSDPLVLKYQSKLSSKSHGYKFNILVTLRPDIFKCNDWDKLADLIKTTNDKIFWWIRKHPTLPDDDPSLKLICSIIARNVEYDLASTLPLFSILKIANLHITTASSVAIEAKLFDVDTLFISKLGELELPYLIDNKAIRVITDKNKLRALIDNLA